jgi:hypothetical protein
MPFWFWFIFVLMWWLSLGIAYQRGVRMAEQWFDSPDGMAAFKQAAEKTYLMLIERTPDEQALPTTVVRANDRAALVSMLKTLI